MSERTKSRLMLGAAMLLALTSLSACVQWREPGTFTREPEANQKHPAFVSNDHVYRP